MEPDEVSTYEGKSSILLLFQFGNSNGLWSTPAFTPFTFIIMIDILVNDQSHSLDSPLDLKSLLEHINVSEKGIAIALNQSIIQKKEWPNTHLKNDDQILIIKATQGG